jgi:hypothetical protein
MASGPVFMFCVPALVFCGTEDVGSRFVVLRAHTHFLRYRGRRVPFSCFARLDSFWAAPSASFPVFIFFARPDSFSVVPRASGLVNMFCAPGLVFGGTEGVGFCFYVLRTRTRFLWYRGRRVPFTSFASPHSFSAVPRAMGPVFMFCPPRLVFGCTEGVKSRFRRYRGRRVPF